MSFLDYYIEESRLDSLSEKSKKALKKIEEKIERQVEETSESADFEQCLSEHGPKIADLVERFAAHVESFSWKGVFGTLRFVTNIAVEVYQIVEDIHECIVTEDMDTAQEETAKVDMIKELTYFVWVTVGPLDKRLRWMPFKGIIEKKVVKWLAGKAWELAVDLLVANDNLEIQAVSDSKPYVRTMP